MESIDAVVFQPVESRKTVVETLAVADLRSVAGYQGHHHHSRIADIAQSAHGTDRQSAQELERE